jgi:hypothetical protein
MTMRLSPTRYTVHGHNVRPDGSKDAFWTRTNLGRTAAYKLAREQRENGGVAEVKPE